VQVHLAETAVLCYNSSITQIPMPNPVQTSGTSMPFSIPSGQEVYDSIMREIEPDLTFDAVMKLETKYANESAADKKARMERYKKAFVTYQERYKAFQQKQQSDIRLVGRSMQKNVESKSSEMDNSDIQDIESAMSQA